LLVIEWRHIVPPLPTSTIGELRQMGFGFFPIPRVLD